MSIMKPYIRNCRTFITDNTFAGSGQLNYIYHPDYAQNPEHYIRAFLIIQNDMKKLFEYIDTSDINLECYSYRTHELLTRACIEVETNFKAILIENGYSKKASSGKTPRLNMSDYFKINKTHKLSDYQVKIPHWNGTSAIRRPFENWKINSSNPAWYEAYHATKHNRHMSFSQANFKNMLDAICGLLVLLSSQFYTEDFSPDSSCLTLLGSHHNDGMEAAIGGYFRICFPQWPFTEQYGFTQKEWNLMKINPNPFQQYCY